MSSGEPARTGFPSEIITPKDVTGTENKKEWLGIKSGEAPCPRFKIYFDCFTYNRRLMRDTFEIEMGKEMQLKGETPPTRQRPVFLTTIFTFPSLPALGFP